MQSSKFFDYDDRIGTDGIMQLKFLKKYFKCFNSSEEAYNSGYEFVIDIKN